MEGIKVQQEPSDPAGAESGYGRQAPGRASGGPRKQSVVGEQSSSVSITRKKPMRPPVPILRPAQLAPRVLAKPPLWNSSLGL